MTHSEILKHVDHTCLTQTATWEQIRELTDDAIRFGTASVCIPPCYVARTAAYAKGRVKICTVIGFPQGYGTTAVKCHEAAHAAADGADEIDMVINLGMVKDRQYDAVLDEIRDVRSACGGRVLKVIVETCLLSEEEKIRLCHVVADSGADYIKTSTGFAGGGATEHDISLFAREVKGKVKIKAAGGITSFDAAERFLMLGADRLGTSRLVSAEKAAALPNEKTE